MMEISTGWILRKEIFSTCTQTLPVYGQRKRKSGRRSERVSYGK